MLSSVVSRRPGYGSRPGEPPRYPDPLHCPPAPLSRTTLPEVRRGPRVGPARAGEGPARAAALSQCGAPRGGHVSLFGAFVSAQVCWCSECGQEARTEQVGAGVLETTGRRAGDGERDAAEGGAEKSWGSSPLWRATGGAPGGWRAGVAPVVSGSGGALALSRLPGGAAVVGEGARLSLGKGRGQLCGLYM